MHHLGTSLLFAATVVTPSSAPAAAPSESALGQCFDLQSQKTSFSGIVAASSGHVSFERVAGFVDAAATKQPSADVPFRLASVQKVLTGVAIGRLVDQGKVSLDAPVGKYLDGLPTEIAQVTIDQLLHHQSGVASMTMLTPDTAQTLSAARSARDLVPLVASQPLAFQPGTKTEYSNGGYYLLGAVIEAASGMSYGDYLQAQIFAPLHMANSRLLRGANVAVPYSRMMLGPEPGDTPRPMTHGPDFPATAAGDGVSSASDMLKLGRALVGEQMLAKATKERIFPHRSHPWRIGQSGGAPGANTDFSVFPESGWVVVVLSNYDPPAGELMGEVMRNVASGGACQPLAPEDRPSPFKMILRPPPGAADS